MFSTDRDLLQYEPSLFRDIVWAGQRLLSAPGATLAPSGIDLTIPGADLESMRIGEGHVALVAGTPMEIIERTGAQTLTVSLLRASPLDDPLPGTPGTDLAVSIVSFAPQIAIIHGQLLFALGLAPETGGASDETPDESAVTNARDLARVEALGALHLIFAAASAMTGDQSVTWTKGRLYLDRFREERRRAVAFLDLDNDGAPDATRRINTIALTRR